MKIVTDCLYCKAITRKESSEITYITGLNTYLYPCGLERFTCDACGKINLRPLDSVVEALFLMEVEANLQFILPPMRCSLDFLGLPKITLHEANLFTKMIKVVTPEDFNETLPNQ